MPCKGSGGLQGRFRASARLQDVLTAMTRIAINRLSSPSRVFCGWEKAAIMEASEAWCRFVNKGFIRTRRTPSGPGALPG